MQLHLHTFDLPLRHTFTISHGSTNVQPTLVVELRDVDPRTGATIRGLGEATETKYYGIGVADMREAIEAARKTIETTPLDDPVSFWERLFPVIGHNRFALCAVDEAAHDLWGKRLGQPVYKLWGLTLATVPASDYTIGIDTIERMVAKMQEFADWPIYKIKLGTPDDLRIVAELRKHTQAVFRVDANTSWSVEQAIANSRELARLGVEFIEQPLARGDFEGMRRVYAASELPIIADESCHTEEDVERCCGCFHGINIKLMKAGGLTPARRMIASARELGMKVMVGCMTESSVGISAIAQLLPLLDYVDMDGAVLLAKDIATGVRLDRGRPIFPAENGTGARLLDARE
jgi:L-alanine-DL-glutamate epimerase-like enolase superfamily enzyme